MKFKCGDVVTPIAPKSRWYTIGKNYLVVTQNGYTGVIGDDEIFDAFINMQTKFEKAKDAPKLKKVK